MNTSSATPLLSHPHSLIKLYTLHSLDRPPQTKAKLTEPLHRIRWLREKIRSKTCSFNLFEHSNQMTVEQEVLSTRIFILTFALSLAVFTFAFGIMTQIECDHHFTILISIK